MQAGLQELEFEQEALFLDLLTLRTAPYSPWPTLAPTSSHQGKESNH